MYRQIVEAMAEDIAADRLPVDTRLPPQRILAYALGISPNTTGRAYNEATRRGLIRGEVGRGSYVRAPSPAVSDDTRCSLQRDSGGPIDLSRNLPLAGFSTPAVRRVLERVTNDASLSNVLDTQTSAHAARHRHAGVHWLEQVGVSSSTELATATLGGQHGLQCALTALTKPGDLLLTKRLSYPPIFALAERLGLRLKPVDMDAEGVLPDAFEALCRRAKPSAFYLTPTLQTPTTATLSSARRAQIATIAERYGVWLLEDDVFAPLATDRPTPLACLAPARTVYITSLSKAVAPGLRTGYLHAPAQAMPAIRHAVDHSIWMVPPLMLEIASQLIAEGTAAQLATKQRDVAAKRHALARAILTDEMATAEPHGLHIWLPLPSGWRAQAVQALCAEQGLLVNAAHGFAHTPAHTPEALHLCLSHELDERRLVRGLAILAEILKSPPAGANSLGAG